MGDQLTARQYRERDLEAAKRLLAKMESNQFGDSDGHAMKRSSPSEIVRIRELIARLSREVAEGDASRS
jgi:hypothetical protein